MVEVEYPFQLRVGKQSGIEAQWEKDIQGDQGLDNEPVPEVHRKLLVASADHRHQVLLEGFYCPL